MRTAIRPILLGGLAFVLQWFFLGRLTLWGAYPDAVLLFVAWAGLRFGRRWGAVGGFVLGFLMDAVYQSWGLNMLAKTILGFVMGLFPSSERESLLILPRQAFLGGFLIAVVHNGILVALLALQAGARNSFLITGLWLGSALYTAFVATLAALVADR